MTHTLNALLVIAYRDWLKLMRDKTRIIATFIFPFVFIAVLGASFDKNLSSMVGYSFLTFVFIGVLGQTLFQSTAAGLISLIEDRENDFSQELFVTPVSRYIIILGKILGETGVALTQAVGIFVFALIFRIPFSVTNFIELIPGALLVCLLGGSFGVLVMSQLSSQRTANQIFPFILFPQFFLAGVFNPIKELPGYLLVLSRLSPMTYAVDLMRNIYYRGAAEQHLVTVYSLSTDILVCVGITVVFLILGTGLFVRGERNR